MEKNNMPGIPRDGVIRKWLAGMDVKDRPEFYDVIACMDIIAMVMILYYHSVHYYEIAIRPMDHITLLMTNLFFVFGLTAFTYSSGFKLSLNHFKDFADKRFYGKYAMKRATGIYSIYFFYTILILAALYALYALAGVFGASVANIPLLGVPPVDTSVVVSFLFFGISPITGHLWYLFVLLLIYLLVLGALYIMGPRLLLYACFPLLLLYFILNFHILTFISIMELPFYICLYLVIFLSGLLMGYLWNKNGKVFRIILGMLVIAFLFVMALYLLSDIYQMAMPNSRVFQLLYGNLFFKYGLTFPGFLMAALLLIKQGGPLTFFGRFRKYVLPVYVLQYPLIIPFYTYLLSYFGFYGLPIYYLAPLIVSIMTIATSIVLFQCYIYIRKNIRKIIHGHRTEPRHSLVLSGGRDR